MSTTAIFVELLIIGALTALWITFFALAALGTDWIGKVLKSLQGWEALLSVIIIGLMYTLGVLVDRLVDMAYNKVRKSKDPFFSWRRLFILGQSGQALQLVEYQRSRLRILRSSTPNLSLIAVSIAAFMQYNSVPDNSLLRHAFTLVALAAGLVSAFLGLWALAGLQKRHDEIVKDLSWLLLNQLRADASIRQDALEPITEKLGFQAQPKRKGDT